MPTIKLPNKKIRNLIKRRIMNTKEKIELANQILNNQQQGIKVLKNDNSLIERTISSKIILTEDNRELLID